MGSLVPFSFPNMSSWQRYPAMATFPASFQMFGIQIKKLKTVIVVLGPDLHVDKINEKKQYRTPYG